MEVELPARQPRCEGTCTRGRSGRRSATSDQAFSSVLPVLSTLPGNASVNWNPRLKPLLSDQPLCTSNHLHTLPSPSCQTSNPPRPSHPPRVSLKPLLKVRPLRLRTRDRRMTQRILPKKQSWRVRKRTRTPKRDKGRRGSRLYRPVR